MAKIYGELEKAQLENVSSDPAGTPPAGQMVFNTTINIGKYHNGTAWKSLVTEDDTQTITNKTIDADNNTISNLAHGAEVDNPTSGVHGATGTIVGTSDSQTLTNKTIDAASNTISNLNTTHLAAGILDIDLGAVSASDDTLASAKAIKAYADSLVSGPGARVNQPTVTYPTSGLTGVDFATNFTTSAFGTTGGSDTHDSTEWEIREATGVLKYGVFRDTENLVSINLSAEFFAVSTYYFIRARHVGASFGESEWSVPVYFTTAGSLPYVSQPSITNPANAETNYEPQGDALTSSAFSSVGGPTHATSDWEIRNASTLALVASSYDSSDLVSKNFSNSLLSTGTSYYARVRHTGNTSGDSAWSDYIQFTTPAAFPSVDTPTVSYPATPFTGVNFGTPFTISALSLSNEQSQAANHQSTTWQIADNIAFGVGDIVEESVDDTVNLTSYAFNYLNFSPSTTYYFRALVTDATYGSSSYSSIITFTTAASLIPLATAEVSAERATAFSVSGTYAAYPYITENKDVNSEYNSTTGIFTALENGNFLVQATFFMRAAFSVGTGPFIAIFKNGSLYKEIEHNSASTNTYNDSVYIDDIVPLDASDTLSIRVKQDLGGSINSWTGAQYFTLQIYGI